MATLLLNGEALAEIDGVLFDKDGTLSHSEPHLISLARRRIEAIAERMQHLPLRVVSNALDTKSLRSLLEKAYGLNSEGVRPDSLLAVASKQHNLAATATVLSLVGVPWPQALLLAEESFASVEQSLPPDEEDGSTPLLPDAKRLIQALNKAGVTCAVISNDTHEGIQRFLRHHQLEHAVSGIWSAEHQPSKPDPAAVHRLCESLQLNHRRCALVGDADSDLLMGRRAGVAVTLGYVAGWREPPTLTAHEHLVHHWRDLQVRLED
ncbi:HAD family hydrolase [Synechococcus sp. HK01-R]|uniref:HAD family hydrolase n=1 Tax=Synechococcus sp. HK01-R TaxID=2751171 RepID=UPI001628C407|nr:HAD-IA family hydrolase [Synechococcus sp. HK01-R]QNG27186.1 HAD family hydrolase [Synechococcus sp. HK01-R]